MEIDFSGLVMRYFEYLITNYGFRVEKTEVSARAPTTEGRVDFVSPTTFVVVSSEQLTAGAVLGRIQDDRYRYFLNPLTVQKYNALSESDKKILQSLDPRDNNKAKAINHAISVARQINPSMSTFDYIVAQLLNYSRWLQEYADPFLRGDFTRWLEIYEFSVFSSRAAHIRSGKDEFVRTISDNKDDRISIFQNKLDYLESLRNDYAKR